jgi:hypothetical protein
MTEYKFEPTRVVVPGDILDSILQDRDYCGSCANSYTEKGVDGIYCKFTDEFVAGKTAQIMGCDKYYKRRNYGG